MQLHQLNPKYKSKKKRRVGRGGKRGTYSGRGVKGQSARAGGKPRPAMRDIIKKIPKKRGYRFKSIKEKPQIVNLKDLEKHFQEGELVSPETLLSKGLIVKFKGRMPEVKILGKLARRSPDRHRDEGGGLKKKFKIEGCKMSKSVEKISKTKK